MQVYSKFSQKPLDYLDEKIKIKILNKLLELNVL